MKKTLYHRLVECLANNFTEEQIRKLYEEIRTDKQYIINALVDAEDYKSLEGK